MSIANNVILTRNAPFRADKPGRRIISLLMIQLFRGIFRLAGEVYAELSEDSVVGLGKNDGRMRLAAAEIRKMLQCLCGMRVKAGAYSQSYQYLIGVEAGVMVAENLGFQLLDRLYYRVAYNVGILIDPGERLQCVEKHGGRGAEQRRGLSGDDPAVGKLKGCGGLVSRFLRLIKRGADYPSVVGLDSRLIHDKLYLVDGICCGSAFYDIAEGLVISPDDLLAGGFSDCPVIYDTEACHIDAHIGGGLIGTPAVDLFENSAENREALDVAVVIDGCLAVCLKVIRVDHIDVVEVCGSRLVGEIDRVGEREVPDRERLVFCIARLDAAEVLMIELGQTGRHFSASRSGSSDDDERTGGFYVLVLAEPLFADHMADVERVALDRIMQVDLHAEAFKTLSEGIGGALTVVHSDDNAPDVQTGVAEGIDKTQDIGVIGYSDIAPDLLVLDILRADNDDDLHSFLHIQKHFQLYIRGKAGKHPRRMEIVEQLSSELKIELSSELANPLPDHLGLLSDVHIVIEADSIHFLTSPVRYVHTILYILSHYGAVVNGILHVRTFFLKKTAVRSAALLRSLIKPVSGKRGDLSVICLHPWGMPFL